MDRQKIERSIKGLSEWQMHVQAESDIDTNISTAIEALKAQLSQEGTTFDPPIATDTNVGDAISKFLDDLEKTFAYIREREGGDSVCGLCEYDGAYIGESGDWCNECPGFNRDDCFKLSDETRKKWTDEIVKALPTVQPERKRVKWILHESPDGGEQYECSECGVLWEFSYGTPEDNEAYFCPKCGSYLGGGQK